MMFLRALYSEQLSKVAGLRCFIQRLLSFYFIQQLLQLWWVIIRCISTHNGHISKKIFIHLWLHPTVANLNTGKVSGHSIRRIRYCKSCWNMFCTSFGHRIADMNHSRNKWHYGELSMAT